MHYDPDRGFPRSVLRASSCTHKELIHIENKKKGYAPSYRMRTLSVVIYFYSVFSRYSLFPPLLSAHSQKVTPKIMRAISVFGLKTSLANSGKEYPEAK